MSKITYKISNFMTVDEFKKYIDEKIFPKISCKEDEEFEKEKKYFILEVYKNGNVNLTPCYIESFEDNDIKFVTVESYLSDNPSNYYLEGMKFNMEKENNETYYIGLGENEKLIGLN